MSARLAPGSAVALALLGLVVAAFCALGCLRVLGQTRVLAELSLSFHYAVQTAVWGVIFLSGLVAGLSLLVRAVARRTHNLVPGPTLYFLGAGLLFNGVILLAQPALPYALASLLVGGGLIWAESNLDAV